MPSPGAACGLWSEARPGLATGHWKQTLTGCVMTVMTVMTGTLLAMVRRRRGAVHSAQQTGRRWGQGSAEARVLLLLLLLWHNQVTQVTQHHRHTFDHLDNRKIKSYSAYSYLDTYIINSKSGGYWRQSSIKSHDYRSRDFYALMQSKLEFLYLWCVMCYV